MFGSNVYEMLQHGGLTVIVLIFCSILSLSVVIEKWVTFKGISEKIINDLVIKTKSLILENKPNDALYYLRNFRVKAVFASVACPISEVLYFIIDNPNLDKAELQERAVMKLDKEIMKLEKRLGILATLGSITPFIGLFGTVIGIIKAFEALSVNEASGYVHVMSGIAEALISTAAGLVVAVPAVIFYNYFTKKLKMNLIHFEEAIYEISNAIKK